MFFLSAHETYPCGKKQHEKKEWEPNKEKDIKQFI